MTITDIAPIDAALRIAELEARVAELTKALEPFAAEAGEWSKFSADFWLSDEPVQDCNRAQFTGGALRRAYALVNGEAL
jgi:hypothetical protein